MPLRSPELRNTRLLLVVVSVANLFAMACVAALMSGVADGAENASGRQVVRFVGLGYFVVVAPVLAVISRRWTRPTREWLRSSREPTAEEAGNALRLPVLTAGGILGLWTVGGVLTGVTAAVAFPDAWIGLRIGVGAVLGGLVTSGVIYLLAMRLTADLTVRALATHPPSPVLTLGVRPRLVLTWGLTGVVPSIGVLLLFIAPDAQGPGRSALPLLAVVAMLIGGLTTALNARAVGGPLENMQDAVQRVGSGDYSVRVQVDDAGEIGMLQAGINRMVVGLAERERLRALFGRHVGTAVAERMIDSVVSLEGEERTVTVLFVDITDSTGLVRRAGPRRMADLLNDFFHVVVESVDAEAGLVNKFAGDGALCVFGAPLDHPDPAAAALRAARRICDAVLTAGEVDIGIGVSAGLVWAGQVGATSRAEYTVIGDPVNEAARLTDLAKSRPGRVVASAEVLRTAGSEAAHWRPGAQVVVRGREDLVSTWVRVDPRG